MTRTWQQTHNHILKRANMLFAEINNIFMGVTPQDTSGMVYGRKAKEHHTRTLCRFIRSRLSPDVIEATEAIQVHGMIGPNLHSWFKIAPDAETLAQEGMEQIQPGYHYIVDPQFPEIVPQVIMVTPQSPLQLMYVEQEEKPCLQYLKDQK
jgi:hypothetical protein